LTTKDDKGDIYVMQTPLYRTLKQNGTSFYAFPGAAEDISAAYQNENYRMYFSKYVLLDLPVANEINPGGTASRYITMDTSTFSTAAPPSSLSFADRFVESLRNYVANHEVVLRASRLNNTELYYDPNVLETTTEKIFWKWAKKLNLISFERATPVDQYPPGLSIFESRVPGDITYFPEFLWRERIPKNLNVTDYYETAVPGFTGKLELLVNTNIAVIGLRTGDIIEISQVTGNSISDLEGGSVTILAIIPFGQTTRVIVDVNSNVNGNPGGNTCIVRLVYHRLVQYIGEVNGVSNNQTENRAYTEVYAHIPDHTGKTPDILFRTRPDANYRPGLEFPIIPAQYQPEIKGAEMFSSPIVSDPVNYPGSYFGQFDTTDLTYEVETGDSIRRSGRFYGVSGDTQNPVYNGSSIDGLTVDFIKDHYSKMNIPGREVINFDQFNALRVNGVPPQDFEFNAILWYYTVEDQDGNSYSNLYGVSFMDHPDNNERTNETGLRFPPLKKLATTDTQDGTSYSFGLNLNFNIIHDNPQETFNPEAINSLFSMNLFNEAMRRLGSVNDSFMRVISENSDIRTEVSDLRQLLYSQTDIDTINTRINNLNNLLNLLSRNQIVASDSIEPEFLDTSPSTIRLNSIDRGYGDVINIFTSDMYDSSGALPVNIPVVTPKDMMLNITNDDTNTQPLPPGERLSVILTSDLRFRQSVDIMITGDTLSTQNKKLDIFINTFVPIQGQDNPGSPVNTVLAEKIDLPILLNQITSEPTPSAIWSRSDFKPDLGTNITLLPGFLTEMTLDAPFTIVYNSLSVGDYFVLDNYFVSDGTSVLNLSGQYEITTIATGTSQIILDTSTNDTVVSFGQNQTLPFQVVPALANIPTLELNKGYHIKVTRISPTDNIPLLEKYSIKVKRLEY
jgi:hypothetical protein